MGVCRFTQSRFKVDIQSVLYIKKIKKVAVDLLDKIKSKIAELDHWTDKAETQAEVEVLIKDILWVELPNCYSDDAIYTYKQKIYEYVYMRYKEVARAIAVH